MKQKPFLSNCLCCLPNPLNPATGELRKQRRRTGWSVSRKWMRQQLYHDSFLFLAFCSPFPLPTSPLLLCSPICSLLSHISPFFFSFLPISFSFQLLLYATSLSTDIHSFPFALVLTSLLFSPSQILRIVYPI